MYLVFDGYIRAEVYPDELKQMPTRYTVNPLMT